jgi:hypothetical protein
MNQENQPQLKKLPLDAVPISKAKEWTAAWRNADKGRSWWVEHNFNAFLVPLTDLTSLISEGAKDVRAYMGIENDQIKLILVGVDAAGNDMLDDVNYFAYDFTSPCPPTCDRSSVLYG